jgi:hypothetical protein
MLRVRNISNIAQKRLLRPLYAHTQGYPYAAVLDPSLRNVDGSFRAPLASDTLPLTRSAAAFLLQGGLVSGTVMVKAAAGEGMVVHNGVATVKPFGLLANFVGGTIDDLQDNNEIGVWRGPDSVWELLKPGFNDSTIAAAYVAAGPGTAAVLAAGVNGLLDGFAFNNAAATDARRVGTLVEYTPTKIVFELVI